MLVPEEFTHLYHTSCYSLLSEDQRLKYNQLYGLRINEQFIQFEEVFIKGLMPRLKRHSTLKDNPRMLADIESVLRDEEQHSLMFAGFNQETRPDLYDQSRNPFTRLSTVEHSLLRILLATPGLLSGLLWLMLAMEELTTAISSELISHPRSGELNQAFIALHQRHLHDEQRHVGIDMKMILNLQEHIPAAVNKINAVLFRNGFRNILRPRRSTIHVIRQLVQEEPGLNHLAQNMIDEIRALDPHIAFPANLIKLDKLPVLHGLFNRYPDYRLTTSNIPAIN
ncbi:MAG: diiron oxygenase [Pseudomonadota bacterium]